MPREPLTRLEILGLLAQTTPRLAALTAGLEPARSQTRPDLDAWSANEVLAHLRACADVWGRNIATTLADDAPTIRSINPRTWITATDYLEQAFESSLPRFAMQRTDLLALLEPLPPDSWARTATVTGAGRPIVRTVQDFADRLARHEPQHVRQIEEIVGAMSPVGTEGRRVSSRGP